MAEELARSSGTPEDVLQCVLGQDFLLKCLRKAKFSADLLQDTSDACEINDLNALVLASGLLSVTEASEKLFLMQDEAATVVAVCRKECLRAGVNFGDGAKLTPEELAEEEGDGPATPAPPPSSAQPVAPSVPAVLLPQAPSQPPSNHVSPGANNLNLPDILGDDDGATPMPTAPPPQPSAPTPVTEPVPSSSAPVAEALSESIVAPQRNVSATTSGEHLDPNFLVKPPISSAGLIVPTPGSATGPTSGTPFTGRSHIPKPITTTPATPAAAVATPRDRPASKPVTRASPSTSLTTPPTSLGGGGAAMNGRHTPALNSSSARPPRPSTAPMTSRASTIAPLGKDRPSSALVTPPPQPSKLPSYAKPTASHKARVLKEDSDVTSTSSAPVTFASTNKPLRRLLYMPPRPASTTPEEKKEPKKPVFDNIRSNLLRPTAAFLAWSSGKSKPSKDADLGASQSLQSEIGALSRSIRAPNSAPPRNMAREFSATTVTALSPSLSQAGMKPTTTPEPFRLASAERHQKAQEELQRKKEEKARLESLIPKFKASPMPTSVDRAKAEPKRTMAAQTDA